MRSPRCYPRAPMFKGGKTLRALLVLALVAAGVAALLVNRRVDRALEAVRSTEQPVEFVPVPERTPLPYWGTEDVESVVALPGGLYAAGAFGVARLETPADARAAGFDRVDISTPLPTRRATAMSAWRTDLAVGLDAEGLFVYRDGSWSEVRSGFGALHVRALAESSAGELWIGAREGLFKVGFADRTMLRLHTSPVRSIALSEGGRIISGGETGLFVSQGGVTTAMRMDGLETPWIEELAQLDRRIYAATPTGLLGEAADGSMKPVPNGDAVGSITVLDGQLFAAADPPDASVRRFDASGRLRVEQVPSPIRRLFTVDDRVMADTASGLAERSGEAWRVISRRRQSEGLGHAHVGAVAAFRDRIIVGFFDGGLAELTPRTPSTPLSSGAADPEAMTLQSLGVTPSPPVWAVNALLDAGGSLHIASLRGAFRYDGARITPLEGSGAAFSLAATPGGVAIGYGEGVLLPERKLLSAFHGLPGNQATALAAAEDGLLVGTPSGLGYVSDLKVRWRVASGEGKLPHPWVSAILPVEGGVLVGTYGGGLTRRIGRMSSPGEWRPFVETQGLKVNPGCLLRAVANGRVYAGTDGTGLFRLSVDGTRFERLKLSLPSPRITALFERDGFLYIGTDEGLTRWRVEREVQP